MICPYKAVKSEMCTPDTFCGICQYQCSTVPDYVSYGIFGEAVNCFMRNAGLDTNWKYHGQLIPFTTAFAI